MARIDKEYHKLLQEILDKGRWYEDPKRKGIKRLQIPRYNFEYDLKWGFSTITTKKLYWKAVVGELLWFLRGGTNIKYLLDNGINIWNKDAYNFLYKNTKKNEPLPTLEHFASLAKSPDKIHNDFGNVGRIYGAQWRNWDRPQRGLEGLLGIDQISNLIKNLKEKPLATDHIVTAWNPAEMDNMALPPCHKGFQLMVYELNLDERIDIYNVQNSIRFKSKFKVIDSYIDNLNKANIPKYGFDLVWEQRSVDTFLGLPFNIASYALLAHIIGKMVNMIPGKIYGDLRNVHIYNNAIEASKIQLSRDTDKYDNVNLHINSATEFILEEDSIGLDNKLSKLEIKDFNLGDEFNKNKYKSYPSIKAEMLSRDEESN